MTLLSLILGQAESKSIFGPVDIRATFRVTCLRWRVRNTKEKQKGWLAHEKGVANCHALKISIFTSSKMRVILNLRGLSPQRLKPYSVLSFPEETAF